MAMIRTCAGNPGAWLAQYQGIKPLYACILSFTKTGLLPQISAAGLTPQDRLHTALADGEFLAGTGGQYPLPTLKAGISPAVISRAVLAQQKIPFHLLSTGLPEPLSAPHISLPQVIAEPVHTGRAMTCQQVTDLFEAGLYWGHKLAEQCSGSYLILGECVVGGTTTAQAVLMALGYSVAGRMSSSHPTGNHPQKQALVEQGLCGWRAWGEQSALGMIAAVGDPMQAIAAGITLAASQQVGVLLAGGSQMLAVYALAQALSGRSPQPQIQNTQKQRIVVGTTRWIVEDESADTVAIAQAIGAPYLASEINFSQSPYVQLRAYERGFVKEGVGAGGCAIASHLYKKWNRSQLRHAVEAELKRSY